MWGSGTYIEGVYNKEIPGTYINIKVNNAGNLSNSDRGYLACPIELPWGTDDDIIKISVEEYATNAFKIFGYSFGSPELAFIDEMFKNASVLYLYRLNGDGAKAKGKFGEARCSGEYGNNITVIVEEDPDNPNIDEPVQKTPKAEIQQVTENEEYNVVFSDCEEDNKIKIEVKKDLEDITEQADKVTVGKSGSTRNVKFLEAAEAGSYTITAFYDNQQLAQQPVTIAEKVIPVTVEINQVEENKEYNVVYSGTVEEQKIAIEVTKDGADITSESEKVTIGESGTTRNVKLTEQAESGTYKIIAKYDNEEKKSQEFTYTVIIPVTAEINEVEANKEYNVIYSGTVEEKKISIEVTKDGADITSESEKVTIGQSGTTRNVKLTEQAESGTYKIIAKYDSEEKKSQEFTYTKIVPVTAEIQQVEENKEYNVVYSGEPLEEQKIKIEVTKDSEDITSSSDVVTIGESGTTRNVKLTETAESGTYKIIAKYDNEEKTSQEFTYTKPEEKKEVTVEINEVEANKEYNVVYSGESVEEQKISIEVTKDSEDITSSSDVVTIGESGTTRNVKLTETAESGTYKIIAKYDSEEKKTQEFTYTKD